MTLGGVFEKQVKAMLLALKVMLLDAEVMLLDVEVMLLQPEKIVLRIVVHSPERKKMKKKLFIKLLFVTLHRKSLILGYYG